LTGLPPEADDPEVELQPAAISAVAATMTAPYHLLRREPEQFAARITATSAGYQPPERSGYL
jgi:hypothetical protein